MLKEIKIEDALVLPNVLFIDVRSPLEYQEATIPGALNIPLLNDEERRIVGTVYKQKSPAEAKQIGMDFVAPKLPQITREFSDLAVNHNLVVLCWRGGMRSLTVSLVLQFMGLPVYRLSGGYKAYRQYINEFFQQNKLPQQAIVLQGLTGVGKTEILERLEEDGIPVVNLEELACNRGSVFGWVGQEAPPSQKMFESLLAEKILSFKDAKYFFVECESKRVGKIFLPTILMEEMERGKHVLLYDTVKNRVQRLVRDYTSNLEPEELIPSIRLLTPRLGKEKVQKLEELLVKQDFKEVAKLLLIEYYDPLYNYPAEPDSSYDLSVNTAELDDAVNMLKDYYYLVSKEI